MRLVQVVHTRGHRGAEVLHLRDSAPPIVERMEGLLARLVEPA